MVGVLKDFNTFHSLIIVYIREEEVIAGWRRRGMAGTRAREKERGLYGLWNPLERQLKEGIWGIWVQRVRHPLPRV